MICVEKLSVQAGAFRLENVSFEVPTGAYAILMGRTGSGKTTVLESICGLKAVTGGRITLMGRDVTRLKPAERGIGFVPQDGALFPTMTVRRQIGFALSIRGRKNWEIDRRVSELAELLGEDAVPLVAPENLEAGVGRDAGLVVVDPVSPRVGEFLRPVVAGEDGAHASRDEDGVHLPPPRRLVRGKLPQAV